jgi:REP element-mobilizing transposase RayT
MSRTARIVLPGYPHHVVHRGHNRQSVFRRPTDFSAYLKDLRELKAQFGVKVHAYCLMPNHVHFLMVPESADGLELVMKRLAGRHAMRLNLRDRTTAGRPDGAHCGGSQEADPRGDPARAIDGRSGLHGKDRANARSAG